MKNKFCKNITQKLALMFNEQLTSVPGLTSGHMLVAGFDSERTFGEAKFLQTLLDCPDFRIYRQELAHNGIVRITAHYVVAGASRGFIEFYENDVNRAVVVDYFNWLMPMDAIVEPALSRVIKLEG